MPCIVSHPHRHRHLLRSVRKDGHLDQEKLKDLIKLFRPDRDGSLACIDFVKSVDRVYKELRLLRASVTSSSKIDRALETILNGIFYVIVVRMLFPTIVLNVLYASRVKLTRTLSF